MGKPPVNTRLRLFFWWTQWPLIGPFLSFYHFPAPFSYLPWRKTISTLHFLKYFFWHLNLYKHFHLMHFVPEDRGSMYLRNVSSVKCHENWINIKTAVNTKVSKTFCPAIRNQSDNLPNGVGKLQRQALLSSAPHCFSFCLLSGAWS